MINAFKPKTTYSHHKTANNIYKWKHLRNTTCDVHTAQCTQNDGVCLHFILICYRCYETMFTGNSNMCCCCCCVCIPQKSNEKRSQTAKIMMTTNIHFTCVFTTRKFIPCVRLICDYLNENRAHSDRWTKIHPNVRNEVL